MKKYWLIALLLFLWIVAVALLILCFTIFKENYVFLVISLIVFVVICFVQRLIISNKK